MRSLVLAATLLAGLLAVTAPPASALCVDDGDGGCSRLHHDLDLQVSEGCPADEPLCILDPDGTLQDSPNDADYRIVVHNGASSAVTVELLAIRFYDDMTTPDRDESAERIGAVLLGRLEVPAGGSAELEEVDVPGNVSHVRVQALAADGREAEVDQELSAIRTLAFGDGPADSGMADDGGETADEVGMPQPPADKDAPALPLVLLVAGVAAALAVARRVR